MNRVKNLRYYIETTCYCLLMTLFVGILAGVTVFGWALLHEGNIVLNITGAIVFLAGGAFFVKSLLVLILAIFSAIYKP